jgi:hypothetical protein
VHGAVVAGIRKFPGSARGVGAGVDAEVTIALKGNTYSSKITCRAMYTRLVATCKHL